MAHYLPPLHHPFYFIVSPRDVSWLTQLVAPLLPSYSPFLSPCLLLAYPPVTHPPTHPVIYLLEPFFVAQLTNAGASTTTTPSVDIEDIGGGGGAKGAGAAGGIRNALGARARVTKRLGNGPLEGTPEGTAAGAGGSAGPAGRSADAEEAVEGGGDGAVVAVIRREDDFQGWLAQQKAGWRKHREDGKLKRRTETRSQVPSHPSSLSLIMLIIISLLLGWAC